jgi:hypothetical protein
MCKSTARLLRGAAALALSAAASVSHATPINFDVVFLLDGSGSNPAAQFNAEKALIGTIHDQFVALGPANPNVSYRFGVIRFASAITTIQHLNTPYSASTVAAATFPKGYSYVKDAVQAGLDMFSTEGAPDDIHQLFLFSDGLPNPFSTQNPASLAPKLDAANVNVTLLGLADFTDTNLKVLVDNRTRDEIMLTSYTAANTKEINDRLLKAATAVPEPGSVALLLAGLGAALPLVRRRRK